MASSNLVSFNNLPDEIIGEILSHLMNEPISYINLASTSKRLANIASRQTSKPLWLTNRPLVYNFYLGLDSYKPNLCQIHKACPEENYRSNRKCELSPTELASRTLNSLDGSPLFANQIDQSEERKETCYYHRMFCLLNSQYRSFSTLRFRDAYLIDRGCIKSVADSMKINPDLTKLRVSSIVQLELYDCDISLDWLNNALNQLGWISYLTMRKVAFTDTCILVESQYYASKNLRELRIIGDRTCRMNDSVFMYFLEHFPAKVLDLTGTRVEYQKRIIQRFYPYANSADLYSVRLSKDLLSFPIIMLYLKRNSSVNRHLIASETDITFTSLRKLLQDNELKDLQIDVENCPMITSLEINRLKECVDISDIARVKF